MYTICLFGRNENRNETIASIRLYSCLSLHWISDWKSALLPKREKDIKKVNNLFNINHIASNDDPFQKEALKVT
jgi:hypothetical protein